MCDKPGCTDRREEGGAFCEFHQRALMRTASSQKVIEMEVELKIAEAVAAERSRAARIARAHIRPYMLRVCTSIAEAIENGTPASAVERKEEMR